MGDDQDVRSDPGTFQTTDQMPGSSTPITNTASIEANYNSVKDPIKAKNAKDYGSIESPPKPPALLADIDLPGHIGNILASMNCPLIPLLQLPKSPLKPPAHSDLRQLFFLPFTFT